MLNLNEIKELIEMLDQSSIEELDLKDEGFRLQLKKQSSKVHIAEPTMVYDKATPQAASTPVVPPAGQSQTAEVNTENADVKDEAFHEITSPMVGTFYASPTPESDPYVKEGDQITSGKVVCILEAMKLFNEIEADISGTIEKVLVENGQLVEYGQPLFYVRPE
ncbi:acetyl-CoA carboxylase biotin carboxyl carrier protein [Bacillaceae bacterium SIJ1]|uniref:acetyl-CoA carboxylase biotin carboxyl carrier protein n=1 Tax=Litoribacterium kuwaitense TaxID=1398745 RepID=UPI0013E9DD9F|nr:acetyl-CoA carboxylase biotin carboxyl carrier protein [Litoribacterium kuwaitense]NGP43605.1 acetyl-CoA carboxylase biotin carboxyl carrier protein [Litoribacterium kuwaitense]